MGYREDALNAARKKPDHPIHRGVDVQVHHLVSRKSVVKLEDILIARGYNIDTLANLVVLPCTLPGACHLRVQLHRGNHTGGDDDHPVRYHLYVAGLLARIRWDKFHGTLCTESQKKVQSKLDKVSRRVLLLIVFFKLPLTTIFKSFHGDAKSGCCGQDGIGEAANVLKRDGEAARCPKRRDHGFGKKHYKVETYQ